MTLGEKIKLFRHLKGYSQEAMADSLGLSGTGYGKLSVTKRMSPSPDLRKLQRS